MSDKLVVLDSKLFPELSSKLLSECEFQVEKIIFDQSIKLVVCSSLLKLYSLNWKERRILSTLRDCRSCNTRTSKLYVNENSRFLINCDLCKSKVLKERVE